MAPWFYAANSFFPAGPIHVGPVHVDGLNLYSVLIENAKLLAKLEGKDEVMTERNVLVGELRDDRTFLREELTEARKLRGDVKEIAQEMLRTLKAVALRGLLEEEKKSPVVVAEIITQTGESRPA